MATSNIIDFVAYLNTRQKTLFDAPHPNELAAAIQDLIQRLRAANPMR